MKTIRVEKPIAVEARWAYQLTKKKKKKTFKTGSPLLELERADCFAALSIWARAALPAADCWYCSCLPFFFINDFKFSMLN